jgi:hypothetical protein
VDSADDQVLMAAVAERADREAFLRIFRRYAPRVKAHPIARGAPSGAADELTQETMLLVWAQGRPVRPGQRWPGDLVVHDQPELPAQPRSPGGPADARR